MAQKEDSNVPDTMNPKGLAILFKEVGMAGFICTTLTSIFLLFSSPAQKEKFIDRFLLFEPNTTNTFSISYVIIILVTTIIIITTFYRLRIKGLQKEIDRISCEKSELQSLLIGRNLDSSK